MANIDDIYLVMRTIAILHEIPEVKGINLQDFEKLLSPPVIPTVTPAGMSISSQRDQLEIVIANNKTDFRDLSGKKDFSSSKIEEVIQYFIKEFNLKTNTLGINFILRVPHPKPQQWIIDNILSNEISQKVNKQLIGGAGTISLKSGRKTCKIVFEIPEENKIEINFNASEKITQLPDAAALKKEFNAQWKLLVRIMNDLDL